MLATFICFGGATTTVAASECSDGAQVYSVYLFHELPPHIRRKTVAEMARVLRPGGVAIVTDSIQLGDRERLDSNLGRFGDFNEPFYRTYITEDFGEASEKKM